jgi:hypothetical protein
MLLNILDKSKKTAARVGGRPCCSLLLIYFSIPNWIIIIIIILNNIQNYLLYTLYITSSLGLDACTKHLPADGYV